MGRQIGHPAISQFELKRKQIFVFSFGMHGGI